MTFVSVKVLKFEGSSGVNKFPQPNKFRTYVLTSKHAPCVAHPGSLYSLTPHLGRVSAEERPPAAQPTGTAPSIPCSSWTTCGAPGLSRICTGAATTAGGSRTVAAPRWHQSPVRSLMASLVCARCGLLDLCIRTKDKEQSTFLGKTGGEQLTRCIERVDGYELWNPTDIGLVPPCFCIPRNKSYGRRHAGL